MRRIEENWMVSEERKSWEVSLGLHVGRAHVDESGGGIGVDSSKGLERVTRKINF
jgi:hypothetical protein